MVINGVNVAEEYSSLVEPNLYPDSTLVPEVTFNPHTLQGAGGRFIPHVTTDASDITPKLPGQDFEFDTASDELVHIVANNSLTKAVKIYNAQMASVTYPIVEDNASDLVYKKIRPAFNRMGLTCLVHEGTVISDTTAITKDNVKQYLINLRKQLRDKGANGNVLIVNTEVFAAILSAAGGEFDGEVKNMINSTGSVGRWLGWVIIESNIFSQYATGKYYDYSGTLQTESLADVEVIAYDWKHFYIDTLVEMLRPQDARAFNGVEIVSEIINGYRVANKDCVLVKKKSD